jgi:hypothetical protein
MVRKYVYEYAWVMVNPRFVDDGPGNRVSEL